MAPVEQLRFAVEGDGEVSALLSLPVKARRMLVLAHGAGAGMSHPFMEKLAGELAKRGHGHIAIPVSVHGAAPAGS